MKKKNVLLSVLASVVILTSVGCVSKSNVSSSPGESKQETITLRINSAVSSEDGHTAAFTKPWMEQIKEKTNGRIDFVDYYSAELVPLGEEIRALQDGTIDIASPFLPTYLPAQFPLADVTMLPLKKSDPLIAAKAYADLIRSDVVLKDGKTFTDLEFGQHNMKALPIQPTANNVLATVNHDFNTVDSLRNMSIRTSGRVYEIFAKEIGSSSVSFPYTEEFEALSKGTIDGTIRSVMDYEAYGFDEILTNVLSGLTLGHMPFIWLMEEEKWNSLPEDVRTVMEETAFALADSTLKSELLQKGADNANEKGIKFTEVSELDSQAQQFLEQATLNTWQVWIDSKEKDGLPGLETAKLWRDLIIKHGGEVFDPVLELK